MPVPANQIKSILGGVKRQREFGAVAETTTSIPTTTASEQARFHGKAGEFRPVI